MADQNVTAGIRGINALTEKESELRRVKETLAREQREKAAAEAKLATANSQIQTMKAASVVRSESMSRALVPIPGTASDQSWIAQAQQREQAEQVRAANRARMATRQGAAMASMGQVLPSGATIAMAPSKIPGSTEYSSPIGPSPLRIFGTPGAASPWSATGAAYRVAQGQAQSEAGSKDALNGLGTAALKVAAGFATVTMAAQATASALAAAAKTRADAGMTKEGQILSVAETSALLGSTQQQEMALSKMLDSPGAYTREQKAGLVESFGGSLAANPAMRAINKPEDLMNVLSALDSGQIGLKQAQDIVSGNKPLSVGLAVQTSIAPRRPMSAQGNKALRNITEMRMIAEGAAGGIASGETPAQRATREYDENLQALREEGTLAGSWAVDRLGTGIIGGVTRGIVESKNVWSQTATGNLSAETLDKAQSAIQRRQLMELEKMNSRASTQVPSPIEGR